MIPPFKKVYRLDIEAETFEKLYKEIEGISPENWDLVSDTSKTQWSKATWEHFYKFLNEGEISKEFERYQQQRDKTGSGNSKLAF